jgi:hypothetical protein
MAQQGLESDTDNIRMAQQGLRVIKNGMHWKNDLAKYGLAITGLLH